MAFSARRASGHKSPHKRAGFWRWSQTNTYHPTRQETQRGDWEVLHRPFLWEELLRAPDLSPRATARSPGWRSCRPGWSGPRQEPPPAFTGPRFRRAKGLLVGKGAPGAAGVLSPARGGGAAVPAGARQPCRRSPMPECPLVLTAGCGCGPAEGSGSPRWQPPGRGGRQACPGAAGGRAKRPPRLRICRAVWLRGYPARRRVGLGWPQALLLSTLFGLGYSGSALRFAYGGWVQRVQSDGQPALAVFVKSKYRPF